HHVGDGMRWICRDDDRPIAERGGPGCGGAGHCRLPDAAFADEEQDPHGVKFRRTGPLLQAARRCGEDAIKDGLWDRQHHGKRPASWSVRTCYSLIQWSPGFYRESATPNPWPAESPHE